jgi:hypothetical protein
MSKIITEVRDEIRAVKLVLNSFEEYKYSESLRQDYLKKAMSQEKMLRTYRKFSLAGLQASLVALQAKEVALLNQQQDVAGKSCVCMCSSWFRVMRCVCVCQRRPQPRTCLSVTLRRRRE